MNKLRAMNPEQAAALFRTILQVVGGVIATNGWMSADNWTLISGGILTIATTIWGIYARRDVALLSSAGNVPTAVVVAPAEVANSIKSKDVISPLEAKSRGIGAGTVLGLILILPLLGGCMTAQASLPTAGVAVPQTAIDAKIAKASAELERYCGLTRGGLTIAALFVSKPAHERLIEQASAVVAAYCDQPPTDVFTALGSLQRAYTGVIAVQRS